MVIFQEGDSGIITCNWIAPPALLPSEEPLVLVAHGESTLNENDGTRQGWMKEGEQPLGREGVGRGIVVSGFLTLGGRLRAPDSITGRELQCLVIVFLFCREFLDSTNMMRQVCGLV